MITDIKLKYFVAGAACMLWCGAAFAQSQGMDKEISALAEKLASQVKESGRKKVTVLDFSDLQGNTTELGRFLAEEVSVSLVERRSGFSVMDRANLKTILAEHKLTVEGLIDPENAKKLGQFSGVDAIVLGSVTPLESEVAITTKIIATDTAEIVGAARARISKAKEIEQLVGSAISSGSTPAKAVAADKPPLDVTKLLQVEKNSQQMGDLLVNVESLKLAPVNNGPWFNGSCLVATIVFVNTNTSTPLSIALNEGPAVSTVSNRRGDQFSTLRFQGDISGMSRAQILGEGRFWGEFTEVLPGKSVKALFKYWSRSGESIGDYPPYRLSLEMLVGNEQDGRYVNVKKRNFIIDVN